MKKSNLTDHINLKLKKFKDLRYGENPHQDSAFYLEGNDSGFEQLWGIELSHNNLGDANHAWKLVLEFEEPTVAIVKHGNPSGIATRTVLAEAYRLAHEADPVSAFGGIIAANKKVTAEVALSTQGVFYELIVAPDFAEDALEILKKKSQKIRVIKAEKPPKLLEFTRVFNGYLIQTSDDLVESNSKWKVQTGSAPTKEQIADMEFAWKVVKHVRSNAIVVVKDKVMVGMGTGQPNRVNSVKLALVQAGKKAKGAVLASDAFFPFADNVKLAAKTGVSVILQPGGSVNDDKVIVEAKKHEMTMIFTGVRHFKH